MFNTTGFPLLGTALLVSFTGCQPGLGHHLASNDIAHAFTQREAHVLAALSTESFRRAVWDRTEPEEFDGIAALMGHGTDADVVDTQFLDARAIIQFRVRQTKQQYRLYALYQGSDWFVDDVLREVAPLQYVSMRRQAEAILAVRDFRRSLSATTASALCPVSTHALCLEGWKRIAPGVFAGMKPFLGSLDSTEEDSVGSVFDSQAGGVAAAVPAQGEELTFYFRPEDGKLVVDDVSSKSWGRTLRAALRDAAARGQWQEP